MKFLKNILAACIGFFIALALATIMLSILATSITNSLSSREEAIKENSVLKLKFNKPIKEIGKNNPLENLEIPFSNYLIQSTIGLKDIRQVIKSAAKDDKIKGIYLELKGINAGFTTIEEIRNSLIDFKNSGKFIYVYSEFLSEGGYYLASVADEIILHSRGNMEFNGFSARKTYFKGMFEKIGIKPQIFRVGSYKSAIESYTEDKMSKEDRIQIKTYIDGVYKHYLKRISESRNIPFQRLKNISDSMLVRNANDAVDLSLITAVGYYDNMVDLLKKALNIEEDKEISFVDFNKYKNIARNLNFSENKIAVIVAEGVITETKGDNYINGESFIKLLRKIREDDKIKSVILRVNSPGGLELSSDKIWREIQLLKAKKSVIASMSNLAASGGYYIAMGCDTIVAAPNTLTGSIGIYAVFFETSELYNKKLGITFDAVNTGLLSDFARSNHLSKWEKQILQQNVNQGYKTFTNKVAKSRNMSVETVKSVAEGRIWLGITAKEKGLVDIIGSFQDAVDIAARKANITDNYRLIYYPEPEKWFKQFLPSVSSKIYQWFSGEKQQKIDYLIQQLKRIKEEEGKTQMRLPYDIIIE